MKYPFLFLLAFSLCFISCTKYRNPAPKAPIDVIPDNGVIGYGSLRINEFICKGISPLAQTYFSGSDAKWFEIYNPTNTDIVLTSGKWFVTDSTGEPSKFSIPQKTNGDQWVITSKGFLAIMCLKSGSIASPKNINATFSLNSTEGSIGIFYKEDAHSSFTPIDTLHYSFSSGALSGISYGRLPNGQGPLVQLSQVTPEGSN